MKLTFKYIVPLILLSVSFTFAQTDGGSLYSRYGIGNLVDSYSARSLGLGGSGVALNNSNFLSHSNPAGWHKLDMTYFETGMYFKGLNMSDNASSSNFGNYKFSGILFGFPVSQVYGISAVAGIVPYSTVKYSVIDNITNSAAADYSITYSGDGGLSRMFIGTSVNLPYDFAFGAEFEYLTGAIGYQSAFEFVSNTGYENSTVRQEYNIHGVGTTLGIISGNFADILSDKIDAWRFGATVELLGQLSTDKVLYTTSTLGKKEISTEVTNTNIPAKYSLGTSFRINNFTIFADYGFQSWSNYKFEGKTVSYLRDSQKIAAGFEYSPSRNRMKSFWEQIAYRGGLSFEQTSLQLNGSGIDSYAVNLGITLPFQYSNSFDLGIKAGIRGTTDFNLVREKFVTAAFTVRLGELWFVREDR